MADDMDKNKQQSGQYGQGQQNQQSGQQDQASMVRRADSLDRPANSRRVTLTPARRILLRTSRMSGTGSAAPRSLQCKR